jgi:hypothetical protein
MDFIEPLDEVGLLSCLGSIFSYIEYLRLELISIVVFVFFLFTPSQREIFLIKELATILGNESYFSGFGVFLMQEHHQPIKRAREEVEDSWISANTKF